METGSCGNCGATLHGYFKLISACRGPNRIPIQVSRYKFTELLESHGRPAIFKHEAT